MVAEAVPDTRARFQPLFSAPDAGPRMTPSFTPLQGAARATQPAAGRSARQGVSFAPLRGTMRRAAPAPVRGGADVRPLFVTLSQQDRRPAADDAADASADLSSQQAGGMEEEVQNEVEMVLERARAEAEAIVAEAREAAELVAVEAEEERVMLAEEVRWMTTAAVREEQEALFAQEVAGFRASFREAQEAALQTIAQEVMSVVADIAEKVIYQAVKMDPKATLRAVKEALLEAPGEGQIRITVPEQDAEALSEQRATLLGVLRDVSEIQIVPDPRLARGGCIVQGDRGEIDSRLETRVARVREEIENAAA